MIWLLFMVLSDNRREKQNLEIALVGFDLEWVGETETLTNIEEEDEHSKVEWRRIANTLLSPQSRAASTPWDPLPIQLRNPFLSPFHSLFLSPHPIAGS